MKDTGGAKVQVKAINDRLGRSKMITKEGKEQKAIVEGDTKRKRKLPFNMTVSRCKNSFIQIPNRVATAFHTPTL